MHMHFELVHVVARAHATICKIRRVYIFGLALPLSLAGQIAACPFCYLDAKFPPLARV